MALSGQRRDQPTVSRPRNGGRLANTSPIPLGLLCGVQGSRVGQRALRVWGSKPSASPIVSPPFIRPINDRLILENPSHSQAKSPPKPAAFATPTSAKLRITIRDRKSKGRPSWALGILLALVLCWCKRRRSRAAMWRRRPLTKPPPRAPGHLRSSPTSSPNDWGAGGERRGAVQRP